MKNAKSLSALAVLALGAGTATSVHAAGTAAGTVINSTATATFTIGSTPNTVQSNTVSVKVDQLLNVTVTPLTTAPVLAGTGPATLVYQVTNSGNGSEAFNLTDNPNVSGNPYNTTVQILAIDVNGDGVYEPGVDTIINNGAASPVLAPDASVKVLVLTNLPTSATDGVTSQVQLTAASTIGTGTPGTLFAGRGTGGVDAVVGATGGQGTSVASVIASLAVVTLTKSASIVDPFGTANPVPGAVVTYTLVAHTAGTGTATNVVVADTYPTGTVYQPGTIQLNGAALTDAADADAGTASATGISVSLGNIVGGSPDKTVTFKVKIN